MRCKPWLYRPVGAALACLLAAPLAAVAATDPVTPAALSATASADVVAGQTERVTLQQAVERAMQTHPALAAAGYEIAASEGALDPASRLRNPEAAFITEDVRRNRATMTAQLNIPLELGGKRAARTRAAELGRDAVTQDAAVLRAELRAAASMPESPMRDSIMEILREDAAANIVEIERVLRGTSTVETV